MLLDVADEDIEARTQPASGGRDGSTTSRSSSSATAPRDGPDFAVDPGDSRFELTAIDPLAATDWYRSQPPAVRSRVGLHRYAACMKIGWHFENLLQQGLLARAFALPNGAPEFRYLHHELIEESQHTLMFQELVNRSGLPVRGMPWALVRLIELSVRTASRRFPALLFIGVLGGERLGRVDRFALSLSAPVLLGLLTELGLMNRPAKRIWKPMRIWDEPAAAAG